MTARTWPAWLLVAALLAGFAVINYVYWPLVLRSGRLSPEADSIAIPMFESAVLALLLAPFACGVTWLCLRHHRGPVTLLAWRRDRPWRSAVATLLFGGPALWLLASLLLDASRAMPWCERLFDGYAAALLAWCLMMRAATIGGSSPPPTWRG